MASLHKHSSGRSPFWFCAYTLADGRRALVSTKKRKRSEALAIALKWEQSAKAAREGRFVEAQARKVLDDILESSGQPRMVSESVEDFLNRWCVSKTTTKADGTAKRYKRTVADFLEHVASKAKAPLSSVIPSDIETFRDAQVKEGKSGMTANMAVKTLRIPFNLARRQGLILTNPAEAVELLRAASATRSTFTVAQISDLLAIADAEWQGMILLGACAGMRIGDASRLTWGSIQFDRKTISYFPQKTAKGRNRKPLEVPLLPDLERHLLTLPVGTDNPNAPLFPKLHRMNAGGCNGLSARFQKMMHRAEIFASEDERKIKGKGRRFNDLTFHSLRHTFVSLMANLNISKEMRMKLAGHTSEAHNRYTHFEMNTFHDALKEFPPLRVSK